MARSVRLSEVNEAAEECITKMIREEIHVTALCVCEFPDGWTLEDIGNDPIMLANMMDMIASE